MEIEDDEQPCIISDSPHKFVLHQRSERVLCKFTEIEGCLVVDSSPFPMGFRSRRFPCLEGSPEVIYAAGRISEQTDRKDVHGSWLRILKFLQDGCFTNLF